MNLYLGVTTDAKRMKLLREAVEKYDPSGAFLSATDAEQALYEIDTRDVCCVLTVPKEPSYDGLATARRMHERAPRVPVVFTADSAECAVDAFHTRAVGYLVRAKKDEIVAELCDLSVGQMPDEPKKAVAKTFGNFDLFAGGKPVKFSRAKAKEMIAYLVYRRGTGVSASELIVNLWEDRDVDRTTRSMFHNLVGDAKKALNEAGIGHIFLCDRNCYRIAKEDISCDYFDYLDGKESVKDAFLGEFMYGYEWAEFACGDLEDLRRTRRGEKWD